MSCGRISSSSSAARWLAPAPAPEEASPANAFGNTFSATVVPKIFPSVSSRFQVKRQVRWVSSNGMSSDASGTNATKSPFSSQSPPGRLPAGFWYLMLARSEEHTSELQSRLHLVCRLLLEKKKKIRKLDSHHMCKTLHS